MSFPEQTACCVQVIHVQKFSDTGRVPPKGFQGYFFKAVLVSTTCLQCWCLLGILLASLGRFQREAALATAAPASSITTCLSPGSQARCTGAGAKPVPKLPKSQPGPGVLPDDTQTAGEHSKADTSGSGQSLRPWERNSPPALLSLTGGNSHCPEFLGGEICTVPGLWHQSFRALVLHRWP